MVWKVFFFKTARGDYPVRDFIEEQDKVIRTKINLSIFENEYYLLHAFKKKSQKTPIRELKVTIDRMREII